LARAGDGGGSGGLPDDETPALPFFAPVLLGVIRAARDPAMMALVRESRACGVAVGFGIKSVALDVLEATDGRRPIPRPAPTAWLLLAVLLVAGLRRGGGGGGGGGWVWVVDVARRTRMGGPVMLAKFVVVSSCVVGLAGCDWKVARCRNGDCVCNGGDLGEGIDEAETNVSSEDAVVAVSGRGVCTSGNAWTVPSKPCLGVASPATPTGLPACATVVGGETACRKRGRVGVTSRRLSRGGFGGVCGLACGDVWDAVTSGARTGAGGLARNCCDTSLGADSWDDACGFTCSLGFGPGIGLVRGPWSEGTGDPGGLLVAERIMPLGWAMGLSTGLSVDLAVGFSTGVGRSDEAFLGDELLCRGTVGLPLLSSAVLGP
jgi:hypothetical protein